MKISKLFHWLYALVMLLPIFAIGSTCLISTFNIQSKQESEIHYKYQTNEVNNNEDIINGRIYKFDLQNFSSINSVNLLNCSEVYIDGIKYSSEFFKESTNYLTCIYNSSTNKLVVTLSQGNGIWLSNLLNDDITNFTKFYFVYLNSLDNNFISNISISDYNVIDYVETHNVNAEEVFYRSVDKVVQSPLFNWSYNSFLAAPITFIVNLFSMPTNSVVVLLLSYWLAISVIWLVFDLVMYVPLLVHRWIDKGVLE